MVWNATTLDAWLKDPAKFIPGNSMPFPGIRDETARADLIVYLKDSSARDLRGRNVTARRVPDLKKLDADSRVTSITYCGDTYRITTADGKTYPIWEFNLRFKTDSTERGPRPGSPALMGAAMRGDRAFVIFSSPAEISAFIKRQC